MREFDDIIRRKLEQLPAEGTPDWTSLQGRLEGDAFDALLRDQLAAKTSLSGAEKVAPAVMGWEALSSKLDSAADVEGDMFDNILSRKLANAETALEPEDSWKVLSHRMDTLWPLRRVLVRYRVLEMAAALALLLTFAPLLRDNPIMDTRGTGTSVSTTPGVLPQRSALLVSTGTDPFLKPNEIAELVYANDSRSAQNSSPYEGSASIPGGASQERSLSAASSSSIYSPFALLKNVTSWFSRPHSSDAALASHTSTEANQFYLSSAKSSVSIVVTQPATNATSTDQQELNLSTLDHFALAPLATAKSSIPTIAMPAVKHSHWEAGAQATFQVWNIRTPVDMEFEQQASSRWQEGAAFGVSANRSLSKRTSLGLGASVSLLQYDPDLPTVFDAAASNRPSGFSRTESFDRISINLAQIPVDFRVRLTKPNKRLNLTAFAGLAGNFTLSSDYDRSLLLGVPQEPISGPFSEVEEFFPNESTFSDVKEFLPGVLEGGSLAGNTFLSGRLGLESSFELNDRISAFSSLSYSHFLPLAGGFGPNNDKLSAVGLTLGARVHL